MIQINSNFSISRLNNPEITAFYINVQKAINTATPENLGIGEMYPAYNACTPPTTRSSRSSSTACM